MSGDAGRYFPRYRLTVDAAWFMRHKSLIDQWCIEQSIQHQRPFDYIIEFKPGTGRMTGKIWFPLQGTATPMQEFFKVLKEYNV
ncbi:hypothetical protein ACFZ8E_07585 [Methylobacterium sp. HMF5984]|uniref:hypothetical protein n=1 Tax=Methylobacterium sp. HMF5984 TaxID=3367370 RepID=UPI003852A2A0